MRTDRFIVSESGHVALFLILGSDEDFWARPYHSAYKHAPASDHDRSHKIWHFTIATI
jgi:hypothetical protein